MKSLILLCVIIVGCAAAPTSEAEAEIIQYNNSRDENGNYNFSFETSNGIYRNEYSRIVNAGDENEHINVFGSYYYVDPEGKLVKVQYAADENGFHIIKPLIVSEPVPPAALATLLGG